MASSPSTENEYSASSGSVTPHGSMQEFKLFETQSNFYLIGWDGSGVHRVLKIDRLNPSELNISEDSTVYTKTECSELLKRIHEGNKTSGGLRLVAKCYGIIGFIKFLGPYYMLIISERRKIGTICGHNVYAVSKSETITLQNSSVPCNVTNTRDENRYKKLLCVVDLTKDFFFSYSYNIMRNLQKNICHYETGHAVYEKMFVWNEFLTRGIRNHLQNTLWTVALVHGFFQQATLSESGRDFKLTLIARRSRHNAGTRYLKRGVNEDGNVANDVETEQIVSEDVTEGSPMQISSVVQNRGSIPLFWSQETSRMNLKPDIILSKKDPNYDATRLHFDNLVERYGNPIIILNLIKTEEKKPRESILRAEFSNAIDFINKDLSEENRLRFLHWDLHKHFQSKTANVLALLGKVAAYALMLTGFFNHQIRPAMNLEGYMSTSSSDEEKTMESKKMTNKKLPKIQKGVLRTNCIDCLDRTNVAQYAYGWVALGQQLLALGIRDDEAIQLDDPLVVVLMGFYERMGDTLAYQYGGSAAHNKVFSQRRGQWRAATQSQEFFRTLQRYYNNAYMDADKQDAINLFLGNFQPEQGRPAVWELRSDGGMGMDKDKRVLVKRCFSDGNLQNESCMGMSSKHENISRKDISNLPLGVSHILSESSPHISTSTDIPLSRCTPSMPSGDIFGDVQKIQRLDSDSSFVSEHDGICSVSNFVDTDWLFSSEYLRHNDPRLQGVTRYSTAEMSSSSLSSSSENIINGGIRQSSSPPVPSTQGKEMEGREREEYPDGFKQWVAYGEALCH